MQTELAAGDLAYDWTDDWARLPADDARANGWAHHDLVCLPRSGRIVGCHPADGSLVVLDRDGVLLDRVDAGLVEGHGMAVAIVDGEEHLWVADCGVKAVHDPAVPYGYEARTPKGGGRVVLVALDGTVVRELDRPQHEHYGNRPYLPTSVAVACDGSIWVGDGYGASLVHRFDAAGTHTLTLAGDEAGGPGRFDCPHAVFIDDRRDLPELYVADRGNARVVVHDLDGGFRRIVGAGRLTSPSNFVRWGDHLIVAELRARLAVLDAADELVGYLGDNDAVADTKAWPNAVRDKQLVRTDLLEVGRFHSPHGLTVDADGDLYVSEWLIGGRFTKLIRRRPSGEPAASR